MELALQHPEIGEAFRAIKHGYADAIIAGGAEAAVNPVGIAGFANCKALTTCEDPEEACTPFDKRRSGFVMGEGAGILILEEYEHAKARAPRSMQRLSVTATPATPTTSPLRILRQRAPSAPLSWRCRRRASPTLLSTPSTSTPTAPAPRSTTRPRLWPSSVRWGKRLPERPTSAPQNR